MLRNYLAIALRTIAANPLFSAINIAGLALGLACCLVIAVFVHYELSYDRQWSNADRIYRVTRDYTGNDLQLARVSPQIGPLLREDYPEVEAMTRFFHPGRVTIARGDVQTVEEWLVLADSNAFEFFELEFSQGNRSTALNSLTSVVLSERAVDRHFGDEDPMGKILNVYGNEMIVTGVFKDLPDNTHMRFDMVASLNVIPVILGPEALEQWGSNNYLTYVLLREGYAPDVLASSFPDFVGKHQGNDMVDRTALGLQPLVDIHLTSNRDSEWTQTGSLSVVYTFSAVAVVILLIACVNFMNLTTARATQRAREVGVRKSVGASRGQLVTQFLGESVLMTAFAMILALAAIEIVLPAFAAFIEKPLALSLTEPSTLITLSLGTLVVGLLAGSYPAFYLSHFRPADVLKGPASEKSSGGLRRALVVFQFATSIAMLIATGVVTAQLNYAKHMDMGFDRERNLTLSMPYQTELWGMYEPLRGELESHPGILSAVYSSRVPAMQNLDGSGYVIEGRQVTMDTLEPMSDIKVDAHWFEHYGIEFLAGRTFLPGEIRPGTPTPENPVVKAAAILNVSAAKRFGWTPDEAIGKVIRQPLSREFNQFADREIVGVIPDIYFSSLHDERKATVYAEPHERYGRRLSVKLAPGNPQAAIEHLERTWAEQQPDISLDWQFLDDAFAARYRSEERQAQLFAVFSSIAILVATLGLFGLASFTTERRTKEIGIRKVMGATVSSIVILLTRDFSRLVLVANVIAWPAAWYFMQGWLTRFAYAVPFSQWMWLFPLASAAALLVAWVTIAAQASRAAMARPGLALRYE